MEAYYTPSGQHDGGCFPERIFSSPYFEEEITGEDYFNSTEKKTTRDDPIVEAISSSAAV
jgi:hypothetical protein